MSFFQENHQLGKAPKLMIFRKFFGLPSPNNTNNYHKIASQTQNRGDNDYAELEDSGIEGLFGTS